MDGQPELKSLLIPKQAEPGSVCTKLALGVCELPRVHEDNLRKGSGVAKSMSFEGGGTLVLQALPRVTLAVPRLSGPAPCLEKGFSLVPLSQALKEVEYKRKC